MQAKVYTAPNCAWCVKAKSLLEEKNVPYEEIRIGVDMNKNDFFLFFASQGARTVPQIYIDDNYVGGYAELEKFLS